MYNCHPGMNSRGANIIEDHQGQRYQLLDLLGKGGFATVYRAKVIKNEANDVYVAIKIVSLVFYVFEKA